MRNLSMRNMSMAIVKTEMGKIRMPMEFDTLGVLTVEIT